MNNRRTSTFAAHLENIIDAYFANAGIAHHGITVEKTNEVRVSLVRLAQSNESRKHVTLVVSTPDALTHESTAKLMRMLEARASSKTSERNDPTTFEELEALLSDYLRRSLRAHLRTRAINAHEGTTEQSPWANTVHVLVKAWLEDMGHDLSEECASAYLNTFRTKDEGRPLDVGKWYFIDGYAVCEGIQSKDKSLKLFGMQGTRRVRLEIHHHLPDTLVAALVGAPLSRLTQDGFLGAHGDLMITNAQAIDNPNGERVLSIEVEAREAFMGDVPDGFDTEWSKVNPEENK